MEMGVVGTSEARRVVWWGANILASWGDLGDGSKSSIKLVNNSTAK